MQEDKRTAEEIISQLEKDYSGDDDAMPLFSWMQSITMYEVKDVL